MTATYPEPGQTARPEPSGTALLLASVTELDQLHSDGSTPTLRIPQDQPRLLVALCVRVDKRTDLTVTNVTHHTSTT